MKHTMVSQSGFSYDFIDGTFFVCTHCYHAWKARNDAALPRSCPKCGSRTWKNCCQHTCSKCGYEWMNSRKTVVKCPNCQSRKWDESGAEPETLLSDQEIMFVLELYERGHGAVKIARETGISFGDVMDFLMSEIPAGVRL